MMAPNEWKRGDIHPRAAEAFRVGLDDQALSWSERGTPDNRIRFARMGMIVPWENAAINLCESPIEQILLAHMVFAGYGYRRYPVEIWDTTMPWPRGVADVVIAPQCQIGDYRVDFLLIAKDFAGKELQIVVERDGHDFHERTKEQAIRDRSRDRQLQASGYKVFRFTGAEIWRDCGACVGEIENVVVDFVEADLVARNLIPPRPEPKS